MSSSLFARELRRQAPFALGPAALLAVGALLQAYVVPADAGVPDVLRPEAALFFASLLLGVASVAPDRGNGTHDFLRRLPLSLPKAFALRVGAGLLWLGVVLALAGLCWALRADQGLQLSPLFLLGWVVAYPCGALASTSTDRPLTALVLSALVAAFAGAVFFLPLLLGGATFPLVEVLCGYLLLLAALVFGAAGFAFCRGHVHRAGAQPLLLGLGMVGVLSVASAGVSASARAYSHASALSGLEICAAEQAGETVALCVAGDRFLDREQRVVALRPGAPPFVVEGRGHARAALSPSGRYLLASDDEQPPRGVLCDLTEGTQRAVRLERGGELIWTEGAAREVYLRVNGLHLREVSAAEDERGARVFSLAGDWQRVLEVDAAGRVYLLGPRGLGRISGLGEVPLPRFPRDTDHEPPSAALTAAGLALEQVWELPAQDADAEAPPTLSGGFVSPSGRLFVAIRGAHAALLIDLESGAVTELGDLRSELAARLSETPGWRAGGFCRVAFRADERAVLVEHLAGSAVWIDLERGTTQRVETILASDLTELRPARAGQRALVVEEHLVAFGLALAPDGSAAALGRGEIWHAGEARPRPREGAPTWLWRGQQQVTGGRPVLATGARREFPLGGDQ